MEKPPKASAFGGFSILALHGKTLPNYLPEALRGGHLHHGSKGQNTDQDFRFIVFIIVKGDLIMGLIQPFGFLFQMGKMQQHPLQGVPFIRQLQGKALGMAENLMGGACLNFQCLAVF